MCCGSESLRPFDFAEIAVKRSERTVSRFPCHFDHQTVRESNGWVVTKVLESGGNGVGVLHSQVLVIQEHLDGGRDALGWPIVNSGHHPCGLDNGQVRDPRAVTDERLRARRLARIVTREQAHEHVGVNGSHDVF